VVKGEWLPKAKESPVRFGNFVKQAQTGATKDHPAETIISRMHCYWSQQPKFAPSNTAPSLCLFRLDFLTMRLTPAVMAIFILIVGAFAFFSIREKLVNGEPAKEVSPRSTAVASVASRDSVIAAKTISDTTFVYKHDEPESGQLHGIVELGTSGFNSFVVNMDSQNRWKLVAREFGESLVYEGMATTEDIRLGLKKYMANMFNSGVSSLNMHFVVSSGALKQQKTIAILNELQKMGYRVNKVTPEQEARFIYKATVPPPYVANSFMLDIGSGNTKVSWDEGGALQTLELPGSRYFERGLSDEMVYATVKNSIGKVPAAKRQICFVTGGVPATLARQHRERW
jgi:hypothetical protein